VRSGNKQFTMQLNNTMFSSNFMLPLLLDQLTSIFTRIDEVVRLSAGGYNFHWAPPR